MTKKISVIHDEVKNIVLSLAAELKADHDIDNNQTCFDFPR
ncbi:hypothetical protein N7U66_06690 [Lacinutrix neustonica]|uniref:Uncharacterized protein n=1 Tax=Lacinutrix neustonica TaxID=2980107 RepID=A0A9E8MX41_9FLAO|nr:hypothetical protein [Lacinutrix neustonica]WAC03253.1 hypothetical protein N7U66_06690 [Lacinutrix neustonica]